MDVGFSFRKRMKLGTAGRINVSKSGIGGSVGGPVGRMGVSSDGKSYVRGGAKGIYYRQNLANNSNKPGSKLTSTDEMSPGRQMSAQSSADHCGTDIENLWLIYDQLVKAYVPVFEGFVNRSNQKQVIETCNKKYLRAFVNEKLGYDRRVQSEDAWKSFLKTLSNYEPLMQGCRSTTVIVKNFVSIRSKAVSEGLYRRDLESMVAILPERIELIRNWCEHFDRDWTKLQSLGWLPALNGR